MDIRDLLYRYRNNQCSEEEVRQLLEHIRSGADEELIKEWIGDDLYRSAEGPVSKEDDRLIAEAFENIRRETGFQAPVVRFPYWRSIGQAAAVVLISLFSLLGYLQWRDTSGNLAGNQSVNNWSPAVVSATTLTLGDGRELVLSKLPEGDFLRTSSFHLRRTATDEITYVAVSNGPEEVSERQNVLSVSKGETVKVRLPDGTRVSLNGGSSLRFPAVFRENKRLVELTGEGFFEVAKDKNKPFLVRSRDSEVKVLGTVFNVNAYPDEPVVRTTLIEGSVSLSGPKNNIRIRPGEQAVLDSNGVISSHMADVEQVLGWKADVFRLSGNNLDEILRQISRWYGVRLVYTGRIPVIRIGGEIPRSSPIGVVVDVLKASGVPVKLQNNSLIINP